MIEDRLYLIKGRRHGDERGWFQETWSRDGFARHGLTHEFVQDNHSRSEAAGVVRGLHFQAPPQAQAKLVRCVRGAILDVAVDLRLGAPTYGHVFKVELSADTADQLLIPPCFAHGFITLKPGTEVAYRVTAPYAPDCERGLAWNDPDLAIDWPFAADQVQLSPRDRKWPGLADLASPFTGVTASQLVSLEL